MAKRGGARPGAGNPGYGKVEAVKEGIAKLTPRWFELTEEWLNGKDKRLKMLAYGELGKLLGKVVPQEMVGAGGGPIEIKVISYADSNTIQIPAKNVSTTVP